MNYEAYLNRMKQAAKEGYEWYFRIHHILSILDEAQKDSDNIETYEWVRLALEAKHIIGAVSKHYMADIERCTRVTMPLDFND